MKSDNLFNADDAQSIAARAWAEFNAAWAEMECRRAELHDTPVPGMARTGLGFEEPPEGMR